MQYTHLLLTEKVYDRLFLPFAKHEFFLGSLFPDIRRLANVPRSQTHYQLEDCALPVILQEATAFVAGTKFHSLVDLKRQQFYVSQNIYDRYTTIPNFNSLLKIYEDLVLYSKVKHLSEYLTYFSDLGDLSKFSPIPSEIVIAWYTALRTYFAIPVSPESVREFAAANGTFLSDTVVNNHISLWQQLAKDPNISEAITTFYSSFENLLK